MRIVSTGPEDPRTKELLYFIIRSLGGNLGRTKLIKLAYLTDYHARRTLGQPVTNYRYKLFPKGPFDPLFYHSVSLLEQEDCIVEREEPGIGGFRYELGSVVPETGHMSPEELFIAQRVVEDFGRLDLDFLLDGVVYKTEPVRKAVEARAFMARLDMDSCNNQLTAELGLDLKTFLKSKRAFEVGQVMPLDELADAL